MSLRNVVTTLIVLASEFCFAGGPLAVGGVVQEVEPALRVVASGPVVLRRLPFAFAVGALLAVGLIGLLMLHTMAAQDAFRLHDLQHQLSALDDTEQQLAADNQHTQAPGALAARARALGMVPTSGVSFVHLRGGRVVGVARAAAAALAPAPAKTQQRAAAKPHASPTPSADAVVATTRAAAPAR